MNAGADLPALDAIRALAPEMLATRHQIHANPELGFEEFKTSDLVAERLARWGCAVHRGLGGTGVVGTRLVGGAGPAMASSDTVVLTLHGKGGHGAMPAAGGGPGGGRVGHRDGRCRPSSRATCRRWTWRSSRWAPSMPARPPT